MMLLKQINLNCAKQIYRHCVKSGYSSSLSLFNAQPIPSRLLSVTHFASSRQHFTEQTVTSEIYSNNSATVQTEFDVKQHPFVSLQLIENKFDSLVHANELDGDAAAELIRLCGSHSGIGDVSKRNKVADKIFNAAQNKTVSLFNSLLSICIKNNRPFNSNDILKQMKAGKIKPNEVTYANLVAGNCMKGDVNTANQIVQFLKQSEMKIPEEIYGYLAYGMCIAGNPQYGFQILESFLNSNKWISSNSFTLLCRGIAASNDIELFDKSVDAFASRLDQPLSVSDIVSVLDDLQKNNHEKEIAQLLNFMAVDKLNVELAIDYFSFRQNISSSFFLKNLLARYTEKNSKRLNSSKELKALKILLLPSFRKDASLDGLWNEMMTVKPFFSHLHEVEYMTLSLLLLESSPCSKPFANNLVDNKIPINFEIVKKLNFYKSMSNQEKHKLHKAWKNIKSLSTIPLDSNKNTSNLVRQTNFTVFPDTSATQKINSKVSQVKLVQYCYSENAHKLLLKLKQSSKVDVSVILSSLLKDVLSSSYFNPTIFVNDLSKAICGDAVMDSNITSKLLLSFPSLFNDGLHGWQLGNFQKLLGELFKRGLKISQEEINSFNQELKEEYKPLSHLITTNTDFLQPFQFSDRPQSKSDHRTTLMNDLKRAEIQFNKQVPIHIICDIIVDGHHHLSVKSFNKLLAAVNPYLNTLPCTMLNFIFCYYIQHGNLPKVQSLLKEVPHKINLKMETMPSNLLQDAEMRNFLMGYLEHKVGQKEAVLILYCSLLKAGLATQASQVFDKYPNFKMLREEQLKLLFNLAANGDLDKRYDNILNDCKKFEHFDETQLCLSVVENFITKGKSEEAKHFIQSNVITAGRLPLKLYLQQLYAMHAAIAPLCLYSPIHQKIELAITENVSTDKVLKLLQSVHTPKSFNFAVGRNSLFCMLFTKAPVDKYDTICQQVANVDPYFKPHRQSKILIDRMQKLVNLSRFDEAITFALNSLEVSNENNISVWENVIEMFGNAGLQHDKCNMLQAFQNSTLLKNPKTWDLVEGYLLYHDLADGKSLSNERSIGLVADLLTQVQDIDTFEKLFDIAISQCSMHPSILTSAFASAVVREFQMDRVVQLLEKDVLKLEHYVDLAAESYAMVSSCEDLIRIDSLLRKFINDDIDLNIILNDMVFQHFCIISTSSNYDDHTLKYLIDSYHKIPHHRNTALAKYIYQELCTTFKYI